MTVIGRRAADVKLDALIEVLRDADEDVDQIRLALERPDCDAYTIHEGEYLIGAAIVDRGIDRDPEILYIGVDQQHRRQGFGRKLIEHLKTVAVGSGQRLVVGTGNSSLDNIEFYQRCGFRMHAVRKGYFDYLYPPVSEGGIRLRDMIVFAYERA